MNNNKIIYTLNKNYPQALSISLLSKELNIDQQQLELKINNLIENNWPLVYKQDKVRLKIPMYTDIGINKHVYHSNNISLKVFRTINSTNLYAKENIQQLDNRSILLAYEQTAGVGRLERAWYSPMGKSLSLTIVLKELTHEIDVALMSQLTGAALVKTFIHFADNVSLKWPNDVLVNRRKVAGILCELEMSPDKKINLIIGVGINLSQTNNDFNPDIQQKATSIREAIGETFNPDELIALFINNFFDLYDHYSESKQPNIFMNICREYSVLINEVVRATNSKNESRLIEVLDILNDGGLLIKDLRTNQIETLISSEISLRHPDGYYI